MSRIQLIREHTHAGKVYAVGDRLEVDADIAEWLLANDIATSAPEPKPTRVEAESATVQRKESKP
jgi:hypothetical protein